MPIETSGLAAPVGGVQTADRLLLIRPGSPPTGALVPVPTGGTFPTTGTPPMNGTATLGTATTAARSDHVHPSDTSRVARGGDTMTGLLTLSGAPTAALHAATKAYVDAAGGGTGAAAAPFVVTLKAGAQVFGKRILMLGASGVVHAEPGTAAYNFAGMSLDNVAAGAECRVQLLGILDNATWPWTPGSPLYVLPGGVMEHTPPTTGIVHRVAVAITATTILMLPEAPVQL